MTVTEPVDHISAALVASGAVGTSYQPTLNVGSAPINVPAARLQAALADDRYPYAVSVGFRSNVTWDEVTEVLASTGTISFRAREQSHYGDRNFALLMEPSKADGVIVVEFDEDYGRWTVSISAVDGETAERYMQAVAELLPYPPPPPPEPPRPFNEVRVSFWMQDPQFKTAESRSRWITTTKFEDIRGNYPASLAPSLDELVGMEMGEGDGEGGKLVLLHGPPGTGKTRFILSLISEWRDWAASSVVTDSDQFFGSATYLNSIVFNSEGMGRWLVIVIEDGDEFINVNGRESKGQAIARLLNMNDGIVGQGLKLLTIMTTNVNVEELNPAVVRPGRCLANLHFDLFSTEDATAWLEGKGVAEPELAETDDGYSLATLYKILGDSTPEFTEV